MAYIDPYTGQEVLTPEEEEAKRLREQEIADTAVHTQEVKTYGDGTQQVITKQEIPPEVQAQVQAPINPNQPEPTPQPTPQPQPKLNFDRNAYNSSIAQQESSNRPDIGFHDKTKSSAYGLFGLTQPAYQDARRRDPSLPEDITQATQEQQTRAQNIITDNNARFLQQRGVEPTPGVLSAAHFVGANGLHKYLTQKDEQGRPYISPQAQAANGGYDKVAAIINGRLNGQAVPSSGAVQQPQPQVQAEPTAPVSPEELARQQQYNLAPNVAYQGIQIPGMMQGQPQIDQTKTAIDRYQTAQDDPIALIQLRSDTTQPEFIRQRAGLRVADMINSENNRMNAEAALPTLSQSELARIATKKSEGNSVGDWLQYLLFKHVGLTDLANAKGEQLGIGSKWMGAMDAEGNMGLIKYTASGLPLEGTKADGSAMTKNELAAYASQGAAKASDVSLTMHQANVNGELHTFESKRTPQGLLYRDATINGGWTRTAPQGMTNIGQQDPAHVKGLTAANAVVTKMSKANADSIAAVGRPQFTQEQIQQARDQAYANVTGKQYTGAAAATMPAGAVPATTAPATAQTAPAAAGKSQKSIAQQILDYEASPPVGPSTGTKLAIMNEVNRLAAEQGRTFNAGNFAIASKFNNSMSGKALKSINTAVDHLDTLQEAANELKNGQTPAFNKIANLYATNTGQTAPGNFDALKSIVGAEVAKAVTGGASALGDREEIRKEINNSKTPEQLAGVIGGLQKLMAGQAKSIKYEWVSSGLDEATFDAKLMPRTRVVLNKQKEPTRSNY